MKLISNSCLNFVKKFEGFYSTVYKDMVGVPTLGYGMTGKEITGLTSVTEVQASKMLEELLNNNYAAPIKKNLESRKFELKQNEFDALVSMAYNIGVAGLLGSTLYKNVTAGIKDKATITANFQAWSMAGEKRVGGLYRRRTEEAEMFFSKLIVSAPKQTPKINYCLEWQKFYNEKTKTTTPICCDGKYVPSTQISLVALLGYVKQGKKYKYCLEFQKFYNRVTGTGAPISMDGSWGINTEKAYETMNKLIKGEY